MYNDDTIMGDVRISLNIPSQKIIGAAQQVLDNYKPIVNDALKEVSFEFYNSDERKEQFKEKIKEHIKDVIQESINKAIQDVFKEVFDIYRPEIKKIVETSLFEKMKNI